MESFITVTCRFCLYYATPNSKNRLPKQTSPVSGLLVVHLPEKSVLVPVKFL